MAALASSSRTMLSRTTPNLAGASRSHRAFSSSALGLQRLVTLRVANTSTTFSVPSFLETPVKSLSSFLEGWLFATEQEHSLVPSLGGPSGAFVPQEAQADVLEWDGVLNAVPKSRVSHSRKRMRSANKGLKDRVNFVHCAACGRPKLSHHICGHCYGNIARHQKSAAREAEHEQQQHQIEALEKQGNTITVTSRPQ